MMIHAGYSELKRAFRLHSNCQVDSRSASYNLLLFYAVESGLKSIYLKSNNLNTTEKITDKTLRSSHDLALWVKELKLSAKIINEGSRVFKLERDGSHFSIGDAHEAWRYNVEIESNDQRKIVKWLDKLKEWLKENLI